MLVYLIAIALLAWPGSHNEMLKFVCFVSGLESEVHPSSRSPCGTILVRVCQIDSLYIVGYDDLASEMRTSVTDIASLSDRLLEVSLLRLAKHLWSGAEDTHNFSDGRQEAGHHSGGGGLG